MINYFSRKNSNDELDKMFYIESFNMEGKRVFLKQLLENDDIENVINEEDFFEIMKEFINAYYKYKLITKELVSDLCGNLHEIFLDKVYIPYRKLMLFNRETEYFFKNIYDFNKEDIDYDYYEFLSYLMEGCFFIYCNLKRKQKFNNIIEYFENLFSEKANIDEQIKQIYNLPDGFILNFIAEKIMEVNYER